MRLIDADALKERAIRVSTVKEHCYFKAVGTREIDKAPTIDAVEVVRCCDCQYCDVFQKEADSGTILMCMIHSFQLVDPTDYCSRGERKDN